MARLASIAAGASWAVGCGGSVLPLPTIGPHYGEEPVIIPYPPPPARVEVVPPKPPEPKRAVWVDGEWQWKGRRWIWQGGQWQEPIADGYYAPAATLRLADGTLAYFPGTWKWGKPPKPNMASAKP